MRLGLRTRVHDRAGPGHFAGRREARLALGHAGRRLAGGRGRLDAGAREVSGRRRRHEKVRRPRSRRGFPGTALVVSALGRPGIPTRARAPGAALAQPGWIHPGNHLLGLLLPLPGRPSGPRGRPGVRPQGSRRVGLRCAQDRRPAFERRAALLQRRARTCVARRRPGRRPRLFSRRLGRGHGHEARRGRPDLSVRHRLLVLHHALPQHGRRFGSRELVAGAAEGQDAQGAARRWRRLLRRLRRTECRRRGFRLDARSRRRRGHQLRLAGRAGQEGQEAPAHTRAGEGVGLLGQALPAEAAFPGRVPRRPLRHRLRQARGARDSQGGGPLLRLLRRSLPREGRAARARESALPRPRLRDGARTSARSAARGRRSTSTFQGHLLLEALPE